MRVRHLVSLAALAAVPSFTHPLLAQNDGASPSRTIGFAAGGALMYGTLSGGDFAGTKAAPGFDINGGVVSGPWSLLAGYDRASHGHADTDGDFVVSNIYLEPRYAFARSASRLTPYLAARIGRSMASYEETAGGFTSDASGYIAGLGAGILWPLAGAVQVDAAVHAARVSHDYGEGEYSAAETGNRLMMRVGVRWAPGGK